MVEGTPFGELLRRHRLLAGLSQEALAERAGLSVDAIRALERGRRTAPRPETIGLLADAVALEAADRANFIASATGQAPAHGDARKTPRSPRSIPLPEPPTTLIGRERDVDEVTDLLQRASVRLVTLTGPGGVGKTRLALAIAHRLRTAYPDGVVFVDLSALRDPFPIAPAVARALGLREDGARGPRDLLVAFLRAKRLLLVLDNFEQVIGAAPLLAELVAETLHLSLLVTSRTPLHLRAEQHYPVLPLETPDSVDISLQEAGEFPASRLFTERAIATLPTFQLSTNNAQSVTEICRRLDGLPLAIELAAARVALLPPQALLSRLERRLVVLTHGARDLPERQQTLRATIDWSYALLSNWQRAIFRRLSVFAGGCTTDAADVVVGSQESAADDILGEIDALVDHSLLHSLVQADGEPRFRMLETVREYGLEQLALAGEEDATRQRHADYFTALAEAGTPAYFYGPDQAQLLERLELEHDNLRAALAWAANRGDVDLALALVNGLWRFWYVRGYLSEGRDWVQAILALRGTTQAGEAYVEALVGLGNLAYVQTDYDAATDAAERALEVAHSLPDPSNRAMPLNILAAVARFRGEFARAAGLWDECLTLVRPNMDDWLRAIVLHNLSDVTRRQGEYERAAALAEQSQALALRRGDEWGVVQAALAFGDVARDRGEIDQAATWFERALVTARELGYDRDVALALAGLADIALVRGQYDVAAGLVDESLSLLRPQGDKLRTAHSLNVLGRICRARGDVKQALAAYHESLTLCSAVGDRLGLAEALEGIAAVDALASAAGVEERLASHVRLLAAAAVLRTTIGAPIAPLERTDSERDIANARATLGDERFAAAWAAGEHASLDELIAAVSAEPRSA
jgi:predicted ATPase/DNA-binding XRE family transcriptional regulator